MSASNGQPVDYPKLQHMGEYQTLRNVEVVVLMPDLVPEVDPMTAPPKGPTIMIARAGLVHLSKVGVVLHGAVVEETGLPDYPKDAWNFFPWAQVLRIRRPLDTIAPSLVVPDIVVPGIND